MAIPGTPDLAALKAWLGLDADDTEDDVVLQESLDAALEAQPLVCCYPCDDFGERFMPASLREAIFLRTQRYSARRNSPEGVVGLSGVGGDFVSARMPAFDSDVWHLEGPYRKTPVA